MGKKRTKNLMILLLITAILLLCGGIIYRSFDPQEAKEALGETYALSEGWTLEKVDGTETAIDLPYTVFGEDASSLILRRALTEDYGGLALSFYAENAAVRVFVDGKPIYEAGFDDGFLQKNTIFGGQEEGQRDPSLGSQPAAPGAMAPAEGQQADRNGPEIETPGEGAMGEAQPEGLKEPPREMMRPEGGRHLRSAGEILVDLPKNLTDQSTVVLYLEQVNPRQSVVIHSASAAKRDVTVLATMRSSVYPLICCLVIIMTSLVMVMLDVLRRLWHERTRGFILMAVFALDSIIYSFIRTDLLTSLLGNRIFFEIMESMCYILMPMLLVMFYSRGFRSHFPKRFPVLLILTSGIAFAELLLGFTGQLPLNKMNLFTLFVQLFVIGAMVETLLEWRGRKPKYGRVSLDLLALSFLAVSVLVNPVQEYVQDYAGLDFLKDTAITLFFILMMLQHAQIILGKYRERMAEERRAAVAANEAKGRFLANMSHEIRTPINAILGMDEMILRESGEKEIRGYAADIYSAGQTLLALINDILDFSRIESGKLEIVPVDYDLSSLIHDLANMTSMRVKNKDLEFEVTVSPELPSRLYGDDVRLRQVLANILTNAVKYTESGAVRFRITGEREGEKELLRFEVEDTGIGIREEDMPRLFQEFERIEEERNRSVEGTGLGMNITVRLLALMGSTLQAESTYGKGSRFWFDLSQPITDDTPIGDLEKRIEDLSGNYTYQTLFTAPDARILVVDDNAMNRKVLKNLLKSALIQVEEASGGMECLDLVQKERFDLIFLDHMMPEMDGVETLKKIRELQDYPSMGAPVIALTANAVAGARERYLSLGFDGFLSKPVVSKKLEETVRHFLPEELITEAAGENGAESPAAVFRAEERQMEDWQEEPEEDSVEDFGPPEDLPMIDGLDWNIAWLHLPDRELLEETLGTFYELLPVQGERLSKIYAALPGPDSAIEALCRDTVPSSEERTADQSLLLSEEEKAYQDYRMQVHGMKSAAAMVGIIPLAGMAKVLEYAARDQDSDTIRAMHEIFLREWNSYSDKLRGVFGIGG